MRGGEAVVVAAVVVAATLSVALPASASEQSEALTARALVALEQGDQVQATALLEQAVAADPEDAVAHYHRGVAYARQGRTQEAIGDLEAALRLRPDLDEAALELGIALVESGRSAEAGRWLEQARGRPALAGQAEFFLGIAALRAERYDEASASFVRARAADPTLEATSRYYQGVADFRRGDRVAAREQFAAVQQQAPQTAVGREAAAFLEVLRAGEGSGTRLYGSVTLQYDSNVVLAPAEGLPDPAISGQADGRVAINVGGVYELWRNERTRVSVGYDFYQDLQFELTDYNVQDNRPTILVSHDFGPFRGAFLTQYDFYLLETSAWMQSVTAMPMLVFPQGDIGRTELYVRFQWRDYLLQSFEILDGYNYSGGIRQAFYLGAPGRELWASFEADSQDSDSLDGQLYEYDGVQAELAVRWPLPWTSMAQVGYRYRREVYNDASAIFVPTGPARLDNEHRAGLALRKELTDMLAFVVGWVGTWNQSNKQAFEYDRQIASLGVEVRY